MANIQSRGKDSYFFTVSLGKGADNKYIRRTKTIKIEQKMTPKQLKEFLEFEYAKFKQEILAGEYITPDKMLFAQFIEEWQKKYASKELSETTVSTYSNHLKNHILPAIGHMRIDQIMPMHIITLLDGMKRVDDPSKPLATRTKQDTYLAIRNVFERAVEWQFIKSNPVKSVKKPRNIDLVEKEVNVYDQEEVQLLLLAAEKEPFHWKIFLTLALTAGLRRSENLGLEWDNVNFKEGTIDIKQVVVRGRNGSVIKSPKTKNSKRLISLPPSVVDELKRYQLLCRKERLRMGEKWIVKDRDWLFFNEDGTNFYPTTPTTWWSRFIKRAGVRFIRLHDLRHTSATLLINQGVHAKIISERLGHSDIRITMNTYGHALRSADQAAANTFENLFSKKTDVK
ncbi:tyrosine-type recombinase/integrase [Peribacillus muralis]|uniref:tyrosine-type recombinase/integrase n=1 Tax=Peribacillus muralis TaxID=264697 RepID=UPI0038211B96